MSGFKDKKAVDDLYESGKHGQDEPDNQHTPGPEEVHCIYCLYCTLSHITHVC